ncbi:MAG TPA: type IV toxin-antitoxin system AbiEi family antitoxin [Bacteroidales bacterium]|nr:type IV toxin-antitoxin system AbiEi family antitoxin [Bacteroidales bacterium]
MYRNSDYIYDAAVQLESLVGIPIIVESSRKEYDGLLTINNIQFLVVSKVEVRASNKGLIYAQLKDIEEKIKKPLVVVAKFIASDIAKEFKEKGINYIDIAGNGFIKQGNIFIFVSGQKANIAQKTNQARAFQEAGIKLIFNLLSDSKNLMSSYRELAEKTGIAIGSVSNIIRELEDLHFILKTESKRVLKNKPELLNRWVIAYNDVLRPKLVKRKMRFADKNKYVEWRSIIQPNDNGTFLWSGEPAGAILTNYLKPATFTIYTDKNWQECAKLFNMVPDENGDIEIMTIFWNIEDYKNDKQTVPPVIAYTDLINTGLDRNLETAKLILENDLPNIK